MRTALITQSNYIPWKGYFDMINMADELILYDHVQYTRRDWRNRNKIKTPNGTMWLTIPVLNRGKFEQRICDTLIQSGRWRAEHWKSLQFNYRRSPYFDDISVHYQPLYLDSEEDNLSQVNYAFLKKTCDLLGITTQFSWSMDYTFETGQTAALIDLCHQVNADVYLSGPSARNYMDEAAFHTAGIEIQYMDYSDYPVYPQLYGGFDHAVSILDLLFNTGDDAPAYMKSFNRG